jgi:hypothetical protein
VSTDCPHNSTPLDPPVDPATNREVDSRRALLLGMGTLAAGAILASSRQAQAGPLNPPPGPVAPSGPTLQEINSRIALPSGVAEPRIPITPSASNIISQPGSYYLTGDRAASLRITAPNVILDLNGFSVPAATNAAIMIEADHVTVRNGRIRATAAPFIHGVALQGVPRTHITIHNLDIECTGVAINLANVTNLSVHQVTWTGDASTPSVGGGLRAGENASISNCSGSSSSSGISVGSGSIVVACRIKTSGDTAITLSECSVASNCVTQGGNTGYVLLQGASLHASSASAYQEIGIVLLGNALVSQCQCFGGDFGMLSTQGGNRIERCKVGNAVTGIFSNGVDTIVENSLNASAAGVGNGIEISGGSAHVDSNYLYAFNRGIDLAGGAFNNCVTRNRIISCTTPIRNASTSGLIAPVVSNLSTLTNLASNLAF